MSHLLQRDPADADDLYSWRDDVSLAGGAEVTCAADEVAAICDGEKVLAILGPGRVALSPAAQPALAPFLERHLLSAQPKVSVCFITTRAWSDFELEVECGMAPMADGLARKVACWANLTVRVADPQTFIGELLRAEASLAAEPGRDYSSDGDPTIEDEPDDEDEDEDTESGEGGEEEEGPSPLDLMTVSPLRAAVARVIVDDKPPLPQLTEAVRNRLPALMSDDLKVYGLEVVQAVEVELFADDEPIA